MRIVFPPEVGNSEKDDEAERDRGRETTKQRFGPGRRKHPEEPPQ